MSEAKGLLGNILVLDLADEKGSFCSRLLADLGATVIKIESPEGDPGRRVGPFCRLKPGAGKISLPFAYNNANKLGIILDPETRNGKRAFIGLLKKADVLVETFPGSLLDALCTGRGNPRRINPGLIHISIAGFGRSGPKRDDRFSDSVGSASGGQMYVSGAPASPPVKPFGPQSCYAASLFGAVAVLLNIRKRKAAGKGSYIDLSIQEAVASTLDHVLVDFFHDGRIAGRQGIHFQGNAFPILSCKDGYIQIPILRNWDTLIELMASENKAGDLLQSKWRDDAYRENHFGHVLGVVEGWVKNHTRHELFELGQAMRFPWAPVDSPSDVLRSPQLKARRFFVGARLPGGCRTVAFAGPPYKFGSFSPSPPKAAPLLGEHTSMVLKDAGMGREKGRARPRGPVRAVPDGAILRGIRVVDLTRMLSGPFATRILADFGADVIKVQSANTAQGAERNDTAQFSAWNRNKRSITLDLNHALARDIFLQLVAVSDVVVENYSPRVMANWGFTYDRLREVKADIVMASISAMGGEGPWKDFVGFAPTFHALSGLISTMSRSLDAPVNPGHAYGDVIAGLYAALAILSALEHRDKTGEGQRIDLSGYEALCTLLGPEYMRSAAEPNRKAASARGDECFGAVPDGCYPCKGGDRWCVISVNSEKEWRAFCRIAAQSELMSDEFSSLSRRRKNRARLDERIGRWTSHHGAEAIVRRLQKAGIAAAVLQNAEDLAKDNQLSARRFFAALDHPVLGTVISDRSALWPWRQTTRGWKAAPLLGEDNRYVFAELLGMSDAEMRSHMDSGIIR